jgi:hypothetical protein
MTILTKHQVKTFGPVSDAQLRRTYGAHAVMIATVRYDDRCNNGHNTLSITADVYVNKSLKTLIACGTMPAMVSRVFPELAPYVKWHLTSSDGPLHYIANTLYHVKMGAFDHARSTAVWPDASDNDLLYGGNAALEMRLIARMPQLMADFRAAVESLGFKY